MRDRDFGTVGWVPFRDRVLLPGRLRVAAAVVVALASTVVAVLAVRYAGESGPGRVDGHLDRAVNALPDVGWGPVRLAVILGSPPFIVVAARGIAVGCLLSARPRAAVLT